MKTSIVILTHNQLDKTKLCIDSIRAYTRPDSYELIVVDNASTDGTVHWLEQQTDIIKIYNKENLGFPAGCNQGMRIATGDNILLLNNDVIVTENWLDNLIACLYSANDIGAVGPITNRCAYYQTVPVSYSTLDEMQQFAAQFNKSNPELWEERLKLIGYAFLLKREVYEQVGELDEIFSPGNFEDDDYSFRIRQVGYKLMLCKDTFIHHFGSASFKEKPVEYRNLLKENEKKFIQKWGFNSQRTTLIRFELLPYIHHSAEESFSLLEIGCGSGGTLLQIKNQCKKARLFGYDTNPHAVRQAAAFADVKSGSWEEFGLHYEGHVFDYIVLNNVMEKAVEPQEILRQAHALLHPEGALLMVCKNVTYVNVIQKLTQGKPPFEPEERRYYTLGELANLLQTAGFSQLQYSAQPAWMGAADQEFLQRLVSISNADMEPFYKSYEFVIKATTFQTDLSIMDRLNELSKEQNVMAHLEALTRVQTDHVIHCIVSDTTNPVAYLNMLAVKNFEHGYYEHVVPYLYKAYELDQSNTDTLHNLIAVMKVSGETEFAEKYRAQLAATLQETQECIPWTQQMLTFILRRIEHGVDAEEALQELLEKLRMNQLRIGDVISAIKQGLVYKADMLNRVAVLCFENGLHEQVIPLLQAAYELDQQNHHTLYNLGYVMHAYGENKLALTFLEQMAIPDQATLELIAAIKGA